MFSWDICITKTCFYYRVSGRGRNGREKQNGKENNIRHRFVLRGTGADIEQAAWNDSYSNGSEKRGGKEKMMDVAYSVLTLALLVSAGVWCREMLKEDKE